MNNVAISYGTYYSYLRPNKSHILNQYNIEAEIKTHNDGEVSVEFPNSIRGKQIFIFGDGVDYLSELLMTIDAAKRGSASEINVVFPYYPYCRQDKKGKGRGNIGTAVIARMMEAMGVKRIITIDLHAEQIQGCFDGPMEHLSGRHLFVEYIQQNILTQMEATDKVVLCSPDAGGANRVRKFTEELFLPMVMIDKSREKPGVVGSMYLLGDVQDKYVIIIDDIVDTAGTLAKGCDLLYEKGAKKVFAVITHPILSNDAKQKLQNSKVELITSDTRKSVLDVNEKDIKVQSCFDILHKAIHHIAEGTSVLTTLS